MQLFTTNYSNPTCNQNRFSFFSLKNTKKVSKNNWEHTMYICIWITKSCLRKNLLILHKIQLWWIFNLIKRKWIKIHKAFGLYQNFFLIIISFWFELPLCFLFFNCKCIAHNTCNVVIACTAYLMHQNPIRV